MFGGDGGPLGQDGMTRIRFLKSKPGQSTFPKPEFIRTPSKDWREIITRLGDEENDDNLSEDDLKKFRVQDRFLHSEYSNHIESIFFQIQPYSMKAIEAGRLENEGTDIAEVSMIDSEMSRIWRQGAIGSRHPTISWLPLASPFLKIDYFGNCGAVVSEFTKSMSLANGDTELPSKLLNGENIRLLLVEDNRIVLTLSKYDKIQSVLENREMERIYPKGSIDVKNSNSAEWSNVAKKGAIGGSKSNRSQ